MPKYFVFTQVESNVPASSLFYSMQVYRNDGEKKFYALQPIGPLPLPANYITEKHETVDIPEDKASHFIMEVMLYRKTNSGYVPVLNNPATSIYSLAQFTTEEDQASRNSRGSVCYFETTQQIKKIENNTVNTYSLKISCKERVFIAPEHPIGDKLDPFAKDEIDNEIGRRVKYSSYPNQGDSSLCGPAAFFYCLLKDRPDLYKQMAYELWSDGKTKLGTLSIEPSKGCTRPKNLFNSDGSLRISGLDWMTLAGLRDSENAVLSYDSVSDEAAGITMWGGLTDWFEKVGAKKTMDNIKLYHCSVERICELNKHIAKDTHVITLIGTGMFSTRGGSKKEHWIVWEDKLRLLSGEEISLSTPLNEKIMLTVFTWGKVGSFLRSGLTLGDFLTYIYGGLVFKKIP